MKLMIKKATFVIIYCVQGTGLETLPKIVSIPHHKVGSAVLILLINKTKQKLRLSKFIKLVQGHTDSK